MFQRNIVLLPDADIVFNKKLYLLIKMGTMLQTLTIYSD